MVSNEGLKVIDGRAFQATPIHTFTFPSTLEYIGGDAFAGCPNLPDEIRIPANCGVIAGFYASNVSRFVFEEGTTVLKEDVGDLFYGPNQDTKVIDVVIPKSVTSIEVILDNHVLTGYRVIIHGYRGSAAEAFVQREAGNERFDVEFVPIECETHTWDGGVVTQEPTYDSEGVRTYTCTVCQATMTEVIPKLTNSEEPTDPSDPETRPTQPEETDPAGETNGTDPSGGRCSDSFPGCQSR